jgi:hypothetical protein
MLHNLIVSQLAGFLKLSNELITRSQLDCEGDRREEAAVDSVGVVLRTTSDCSDLGGWRLRSAEAIVQVVLCVRSCFVFVLDCRSDQVQVSRHRHGWRARQMVTPGKDDQQHPRSTTGRPR